MSFACEFCKRIFTQNRNLKQHTERCKQKDIVLLTQQYESQIQIIQEQLEHQREEYEKQLEHQKEQYEQHIQSLKEQLTEFKTQIFEIAKQPKQINNNNSKHTTNNNQKTLNIMNQLTPYDLTVERVQNILDKYSLEKIFKNGPNSIADFVVEKILTDTETQKPKLIATDRSRGVFKYKDSDGNIHIDNKLTKTTDILQQPLFKANDQVLLDILRRHNFDIDDFTRKIFNENSDLLNSINKEKLSAKLTRRLDSEYISINPDS